MWTLFAWDAFLLVAALVLFRAAGFAQGYASHGSIGPIFWPRLVLALMAATALADIAVHVVAKVRGGAPAVARGSSEATGEPSSPDGGGAAPHGGNAAAVAGIVLLIAYVVALPYAGFVVDSVVFLVLLMVVAGYRNVWATAAIAVVVPVALAFVFVRILQMILPVGSGAFEAFTVSMFHALGIFKG